MHLLEVAECLHFLLLLGPCCAARHECLSIKPVSHDRQWCSNLLLQYFRQGTAPNAHCFYSQALAVLWKDGMKVYA